MKFSATQTKPPTTVLFWDQYSGSTRQDEDAIWHAQGSPVHPRTPDKLMLVSDMFCSL